MTKLQTTTLASFLILLIFTSCTNKARVEQEMSLKEKVKSDAGIAYVTEKALEIVKTGFNAGDGYGEVWIRDYNTFIELSAEVYPQETLKENLRVFFRLQREDGNIIDGFIPKEKAKKSRIGYEYIYTDLEPNYAGHKNTVETDHETSLVQAVYKYVKKTGDTAFLEEKIGDRTVAQRMIRAMEFLMNNRWTHDYDLIWGATTADWGDVQHCHPWGVFITEDTKYCVDIYDNAMFIIALNNLIEMVPACKGCWRPIRDMLKENTMKVLWDEENEKFIPHVYMDGSPYPADFNENEIYYHGGTAVAIEAGLLNKEQIKTALQKMNENVKASGAGSIGLTMYPPYPKGSFENKSMVPYGYQNGGDWTWFGGRMIQQLVKYGFAEEAYEALKPMTDRVLKNKGFYEWYTVENKPKGSGTFRGSAGVLYKAIEMLEAEISDNK